MNSAAELINRCLSAGTAPRQMDEGWMKLYWAFYVDCQACPFKTSCVPKADYKQLVRSAFNDAYRRAWHRQRSPQAQHLRRVRQRTVEPVFGSLLQHYGLRRVGTKGRAAAHKMTLLTALAYNLKQLLKHASKQVLGMALALPVSPPPPPGPLCRLRRQRQRIAPKEMKRLTRTRPESCNSHHGILDLPSSPSVDTCNA